MLNRERTGITKIRLRLGAAGENLKADWRDVVCHAVCQCAHTKASEPTEDEQEEPAVEPSTCEWVAISRMLLDRLKSNVSLEVMGKYARNKFLISPQLAENICRRYSELVASTELDDFEPRSSALLRPVTSHNNGVARGHGERDRFIAITQKWIQSGPMHKELLGQFIERWEAKVDARNPRVVCANQKELDQAISLLTSLGLDSSQLVLETHGDQMDQWLEGIALLNPGTRHSEHRASRGSNRILVKEVSIAIKQLAGQIIPDGRDFHRALISLSVACAM